MLDCTPGGAEPAAATSSALMACARARSVCSATSMLDRSDSTCCDFALRPQFSFRITAARDAGAARLPVVYASPRALSLETVPWLPPVGISAGAGLRTGGDHADFVAFVAGATIKLSAFTASSRPSWSRTRLRPDSVWNDTTLPTSPFFCGLAWRPNI
eukprot:4454088-Prymnesium_polylepis.1